MGKTIKVIVILFIFSFILRLPDARAIEKQDKAVKENKPQDITLPLRSQIQALEKDKTALRGQVASLESKNNSLDKEIANSKAVLGGSNKKISSLEAELSKLRPDVISLKKKSSSLEADINKKFNELKTVNAENASLKQQLTEKDKQASVKKEVEKSSSVKEIDSLNKQLKEKADALSRAESEKSSLSS
ncbi:MAG: hypothetical protein Q8L26_05020, partial [Candidatus Omnitrophota bacterium]|nr:hypothetical protein [Candidatus Omnitrophota bacterium]